jgi:NTP pyrophosphatase (non-canonical NTP hydrolase)
MDIKEIIALQIEQDDKIGFPVKFSDNSLKYQQLTKDLVGLFGEIGEFSNIVKKINIKLDKKDLYNLDLSLSEENLKEELVDTFIYILRISAILDLDLERETIKKMEFNANRYE